MRDIDINLRNSIRWKPEKRYFQRRHIKFAGRWHPDEGFPSFGDSRPRLGEFHRGPYLGRKQERLRGARHLLPVEEKEN